MSCSFRCDRQTTSREVYTVSFPGARRITISATKELFSPPGSRTAAPKTFPPIPKAFRDQNGGGGNEEKVFLLRSLVNSLPE